VDIYTQSNITQVPEKCKENFDVSSEGPSSLVTQDEVPALEILLIFLGSCIPTNESLFILLALPTRGVQIRSETDPNPIRSDFGTKIFISDRSIKLFRSRIGSDFDIRNKMN
jgi:hypothetical protein